MKKLAVLLVLLAVFVCGLLVGTASYAILKQVSQIPHHRIRSKDRGRNPSLSRQAIVETIAVMAKYNPFFEKAGMTKIAETTPNPQVLKVVEKLRAFNFNPVFLTSERTNCRT
jgi:hypothetical protein